jgi:hypothetical protein
MKKLFLIVLAFVSFLYAADSTAVFHSDTMNEGLSTRVRGLGVDVIEYVLFDATEHTSDTIAAGDYLIIGPFPLHFGTLDGQYSYMNLCGQALAAGDTAQIAYQVTCGSAITDTASNWTIFDSCDAVSGVTQTAVDLTQKTGSHLWIQIYNITASAINMAFKLNLYMRKKLPIK